MNARWVAVVALTLCVVSGPAAAADAGVVILAEPGTGARPVSAEFNPALFPGLALGDVHAVLDHGDGKRRLLPTQCTLESATNARVTFVLPEGDGGPVHLYTEGQDFKIPALDLAGPAPLQVRQENGRVIVNNGFAEVVHDPAVQAGLPARVTFLKTAKVIEGYVFNDRVYDGGRGGYSLRYDSAAEVRLLSAGPLEAVVEVRARYLRGNDTHESDPRATYTFTYWAGTPAVEVTAHCTQSPPFRWPEHHLMEWNFPGMPFKTWAGGEPRTTGTFSGEAQSANTGRWGAITDGSNVVGVISGNVKFYSGQGAYGGYIHGPWTSWDGTEQTLGCTIWLDARDDALDALEAYAQSSGGPPDVLVSTPEIEKLRKNVAQAVEALPAGRLRGLHAWWNALTEGVQLKSGDLEGARRGFRAQLDLAAADAGDVLRGLEKSFPGYRFQCDASTGVMWSPGETGFSPEGIFSFVQEREFLAGKEGHLWSLEIEGPGDEGFSLTNESNDFTASAIDDGPGMAFTWTGRDRAEGLTVHMTALLDNGACSLRLGIENDTEDRSLSLVRFPEMTLGRIGASAEDDVFFKPTVSGAVAKAPLLNGLDFRASYPSGWGSLQFAAHYDGDAGIYLGVHDPLASIKTLLGASSKNGRTLGYSVEWPAPDATRPGNDFELPGEVVIAPYAGDWFDAAVRYRDWMAENAEWRAPLGRPDTPDWMREICVWTRYSGNAASAVGPVKRFAEAMGVPTGLHWYCWHQIPFDNNYPHYFPVTEGFAEGVAELQKAGVRVMPYINGRLWDSDTDDFQAVALPGTAKGRDGKYYVEHYGSHPQDLVPMCPTQKVWRDKVHEIVLRLLSPECNVDGVYIDQVAAAAPKLCFDPAHGHPLQGGHWWTVDGYWPMLTELQATMEKKYPDKVLTTECTAEPYTHVFDGYLTWHYQYQDAVPAVAAVYGGRIQFFGRAYNGKDQLAHRMRTAQALVFGEQLGWMPAHIITDNQDTTAHLRRCARIRHQLYDYLAIGLMARPPRLEGDIPNVTADWAWSGNWDITDSAVQRGAWQAADGSVAFIFANSTQEEQAFTWRFDAVEYGFAPGGLSSWPVTETGRGDKAPVERRFEREMTAGPLAVDVLVIGQ